ncbi:arginase family protein [Flavivirga eckloniae]|uniref:Arginase n=1 Tax=Flavivirga eckloniae TaxID=1803846 RepID=A0A2K9PMN5_9FLAO|nr:arginase family protein [Flavivirga eckloniae]AUP78098.1 arginase [Flavivirga eckloniae]
MNSHKIYIVEFPSNLGLKQTDYAIEPSVKKLPKWLKQFGLHKQVNPERVLGLEPPSYSMDFDKESGVRNADKIIKYAKEQSQLLESLKEEAFKIVIGGDCSILIGSAIALKKKGEFGLFFIDGHTDFILPEISQTGGAAGMDLAIVTGYGHEKLTNIHGLNPYFMERNVFCVGNRAFDEDYVQPILDSEIGYYNLNRLRRNGFKNTVDQFLKLVNDNRLDGFFIHLDLDVLNDDIMPAVDSRAKGGLTYVELSELLIPLISSEKAVGIEITILDPDLDKNGKYTIKFVQHFVEILKSVSNSQM